MPRPGFYNDNEYRAYPFIAKTATINIGDCGVPAAAPAPSGPQIPDAAIVDAGFIMGLDSAFNSKTDSVYLSRIRRTALGLEFEFSTTAANANNEKITFSRLAAAEEWENEFNISSPANAECAEEPLWEGFIVTGDLTDLLATMTIGATLDFSSTDYVIEPGRVQSLLKSYLRSISVGNYQRIMATPPNNCAESESAFDPNEERPIIVNARCMDGDLRLKEGYNCQIRQLTRDNTIQIGTAALINNAGGELCLYGSELPFFDGDLPPEDSPFLSGGPACDDVISTINGIPGPNVQLVGGTGVKIVTTQGENKIKIQLARNTLTTENC